MGTTYGASGIRDYDDVQGSSTVNLFEVDIDTSADASCIYAELGFNNELGAVRGVLLNGSTSLSMNWRLWTNSTTSTYAGSNQTNFACNYWTMGAANNTTYGSMENMRIQVWVYNRLFSSEPYSHPWVVGSVCYESNNGLANEARFTVRSRSTSQITGLRFYTTSYNNISWYRGRSWSVMGN